MSLTHLPTTENVSEIEPDHDGPYNVGDRVTVKCKPGYKLSNFTSVVVKTSDGKLVWDPETLKCAPVSCGIPPILEHGNVDSLLFTFPNSIRYACNRGYEFSIPQSNVKFHCGASGEWTPRIPNMRCRPVQCPKLDDPLNGKIINITEKRNIGSVVTFECDPDYTMIGDPERVCQHDSQWSGRAQLN